MAIEIKADRREIGSLSYLEIPIKESGGGNLWILISGITLIGLDVDSPPDTYDFYIETNYRLRDNDRLVNSCVFPWLSSIGTDNNFDEHSPMTVGLNEASVQKDTSNIITLYTKAELGGDTTLFRIGFHINLLVSRQF